MKICKFLILFILMTNSMSSCKMQKLANSNSIEILQRNDKFNKDTLFKNKTDQNVLLASVDKHLNLVQSQRLMLEPKYKTTIKMEKKVMALQNKSYFKKHTVYRNKATQEIEPFGLVSFILLSVAFIIALIPPFFILSSILALAGFICAFISLLKFSFIDDLKGKGFGIAGFILSAIYFILYLIAISVMNSMNFDILNGMM